MLRNPLVWFIAVALLVLTLCIPTAESEELVVTLTKAKQLSNAPCTVGGEVLHCFLVEHKGVQYLVITVFVEAEYVPILIYTKEREVWRYNDVRT
jgi:hypothetical protein